METDAKRGSWNADEAEGRATPVSQSARDLHTPPQRSHQIPRPTRHHGEREASGLTAGQVLIVDSTDELTLVFDLAIYTAKEGRTRAIDRYAKAAQLPAGSDEMRMLEAMCRARFSIWRIERRHDICGLVVTDQLQQAETWLVDEALAATARHGMCFAGRLCNAGQFAITNGVMVPVHGPMIEEVLTDSLASCHVGPQRV